MQRRSARHVESWIVLAAFATLLTAACTGRGDRDDILVVHARLAESLQRQRVRSAQRAPTHCGSGGQIREAVGCARRLILGVASSSLGESGLRIQGKLPGWIGRRPAVVTPIFHAGLGIIKGVIEGDAFVVPAGQGSFDRRLDATNLPPKAAKRARLATIVLPDPRQSYRSEAITVPEHSWLQVGVGFERLPLELEGTSIEFRITAIPEEGGAAVELLRSRRRSDRDRTWQDHRLDLAQFAGQAIRFRLETRPVGTAAEAAVAPPLWGAPRILVSEPGARRRRMVLISLDTLRADHVGRRFHGRALTPRIDRLAREGTVFTSMMTTHPTTTAAHMSMLTGLYPSAHHVWNPTQVLSSDVPLLAERLAAAGYETSAVTEGGMVAVTAGFARGFDFYRENADPRAFMLRGSSSQTFREALGWAEKHAGELFFLFVHSYEVHAPYLPVPGFDVFGPEGASREVSGPEADHLRYADEVLHLDHEVGLLVDELERRFGAEGLIVAIVSDHGEAFGEHGVTGHGVTLFEEELHVPFILWSPGLVPAGRQVQAPASLVDVTPTLLELAGVPREEPAMQGVSLVPWLGPELPRGERTLFAEGFPGPLWGKGRGRAHAAAVRRGAKKWIFPKAAAQGVLAFDLDSDPEEREPATSGSERDVIEALGRHRAAGNALGRKRGHATIGGTETEKLRALGYIE